MMVRAMMVIQVIKQYNLEYKAARERLFITPAELAYDAGVSEAVVLALEAGEWISPDDLYLIEEALDWYPSISADDASGGDDGDVYAALQYVLVYRRGMGLGNE